MSRLLRCWGLWPEKSRPGAIAPAGNGLVAQQTQAAVQIEAGADAINLTSYLSEETEEESEFGELNIRELLRRSAIAGSGSWLLAIGLVSLLGTVWISTLIWLLLLAGVIFSQYRPLKQKFYFFITLVITNTIIFVLFPAWSILNPVQLGIQGLAIVGLLTVLAILLSYTLMGVSRLCYRFVLPYFKKIISELI